MEMLLEFDNVYLFSEIAKRNKLNELYWPNQEKICFNDEDIVNKNWHQGWHCCFSDKGLQLEINSILTEEQYQYRTKNNLSIQKNKCEFHKKYSFKLQNIEVLFKIQSQYFEKARKEFYISELFGDLADKIWSAEFFDPVNVNQAYFFLGFERKKTYRDEEKIKILKDIAEKFK